MRRKKHLYIYMIVISAITLITIATGLLVIPGMLSSSRNKKLKKEPAGEAVIELADVPDESLETDEESGQKFFNGYLFAMTTDDLAHAEKRQLAATVDGEVIGEQSGAVNSIQIRIDETSYEAGCRKAEKLMDDQRVLYAGWESPVQFEEAEVSDQSPWSDGGVEIEDKPKNLQKVGPYLFGYSIFPHFYHR